MHDDLNDLRTWWSFRENVAEDASLAIASIDLFAGGRPDWTFPGLFRTDRIREISKHGVKEIIGTAE